MQKDVGGVTEFQRPHPVGLSFMVPQHDRATEGRVNPKGIPCLYLSTNREVAISEVRPWIGALVTVARFETMKELQLIDLTTDDPDVLVNYYTGCEEPSADVREALVWANMNQAFSEPVTRSDDIADYAPTQMLAETFREGRYDGIIYGSSFGEGGKNVALFNLLDRGTMVSHQLYRVYQMKHEFLAVSQEFDPDQ